MQGNQESWTLLEHCVWLIINVLLEPSVSTDWTLFSSTFLGLNISLAYSALTVSSLVRPNDNKISYLFFLPSQYATKLHCRKCTKMIKLSDGQREWMEVHSQVRSEENATLQVCVYTIVNTNTVYCALLLRKLYTSHVHYAVGSLPLANNAMHSPSNYNIELGLHFMFMSRLHALYFMLHTSYSMCMYIPSACFSGSVYSYIHLMFTTQLDRSRSPTMPCILLVGERELVVHLAAIFLYIYIYIYRYITGAAHTVISIQRQHAHKIAISVYTRTLDYIHLYSVLETDIEGRCVSLQKA